MAAWLWNGANDPKSLSLACASELAVNKDLMQANYSFLMSMILISRFPPLLLELIWPAVLCNKWKVNWAACNASNAFHFHSSTSLIMLYTFVLHRLIETVLHKKALNQSWPAKTFTWLAHSYRNSGGATLRVFSLYVILLVYPKFVRSKSDIFTNLKHKFFDQAQVSIFIQPPFKRTPATTDIIQIKIH